MMRQMKKDGIKVSISGSAADEIYSGYIDHFNQFLYQIKDDRVLLAKTNLIGIDTLKDLYKTKI